MLTFVEYLTERENVIARARCEKYIEHAGIESYITPHSSGRSIERDVGRDVLEQLVKKCLEFVKQKPAEAGKSSEVLFYSSKLKQGLIASYRRDIGGNAADKTKYFFIVTILPPGKNLAKPGTHKIAIKETITSENVIQLYESLGVDVPHHVIVLD